MTVEAGSPVDAPRGRWPRIWAAIDERVGLSGLAYPVPAHANTLGYTLGGITLFGIMVLAATGILLAQFFDPSPVAARDSIIFIVERAPLGNFLRGIHFWVAQLVVVTAILHLTRIFGTGAFKRPREFNWLIGVGLFAVLVGFAFTGTVLKWDQEAFEALEHNTEVAELLGGAGYWFGSDFARSVPLLERVYSAHVTILPALITGLLITHLLLVKRHGISPRPADVDAGISGPVVPADKLSANFAGHLRHLVGYGLLLTGVAGILALVFQPELGPAPIAGVELTKPGWIFLPFYSLENWMGIKALLYGSSAVFGLLAIVPFADRSRWRTPARRKVATGVATVFVVTLAVLGFISLVAPVANHLGG